MASCLNLEDALGVTPPANGRIMRNLVLGANFIMSHILHFYHLAALDYINTDGLLGGIIDKGPWQPHYVAPDMVTGDTAAALVGHYVQALAMRRKAHQMGAIFGGKLPCAPTFVPGGCTAVPTTASIAAFRTLLSGEPGISDDLGLRGFIDNTYIPDVLTVAGAFPAYFGIGAGCGNLLAYGVFDLDNSDQNKLLYRGRYTDGSVAGVEPTEINEDVKYSRYDDADSGLNPADGITEPDTEKTSAYSWLKAPRYQGTVHEAGPLARMAVNYLSGDATTIGLIESVLGANPDISVLFSVLGRHAARVLEAKLVADAMDGWLNELVPGQTSYEEVSIPRQAKVGIGLTEAPRGALGHWITTTSRGKIDRYQVITPTNWNASPKDDNGQPGPIEQALIGTKVEDNPIEVEILRIVHSFDPCLACSVHMVRPGKTEPEMVVHTRPSI